MKRKNGIQRAIDAAGSQSELARLLGISPQSVQLWAAAGEIPFRRCKDVKKITGVKLSVLRPDIWNVKS